MILSRLITVVTEEVGTAFMLLLLFSRFNVHIQSKLL